MSTTASLATIRQTMSEPAVKARWLERVRGLMRLSVLAYICLMPFSNALKETSGVMALIGVLAFYLLDWRGSRLARLPIRWLYLAFILLLAFKTIHSIDPSESWYSVRTNIHGGLALFLAGIEFPRSRRDILLLVGAFTVMGLAQGLDGVYQALTGFDLVHGTPLNNGERLTGSMDTPRVGNLISLVIPIAAAWVWLLPERWPLRLRVGLSTATLLPMLFLLLGAGARSGILGVAVALLVGALLIDRKPTRALLLLAGLLAMAGSLLFLGPERATFERASADPRLVDIWPFAWRVFEEYPVLGSGLSTYNIAAGRLGLSPVTLDSIPQHPHNIYLQFLCETGLVGTAVLLAFLVSSLTWLILRVRRGLMHAAEPGAKREWAAAMCFMASYAGYTTTALSAHSFFRSWWLGLSMLILGLCLGLVDQLTSTAALGTER